MLGAQQPKYVRQVAPQERGRKQFHHIATAFLFMQGRDQSYKEAPAKLANNPIQTGGVTACFDQEKTVRLLPMHQRSWHYPWQPARNQRTRCETDG